MSHRGPLEAWTEQWRAATTRTEKEARVHVEPVIRGKPGCFILLSVVLFLCSANPVLGRT
jgi:hypothetical protein